MVISWCKNGMWTDCIKRRFVVQADPPAKDQKVFGVEDEGPRKQRGRNRQDMDTPQAEVHGAKSGLNLPTSVAGEASIKQQ